MSFEPPAEAVEEYLKNNDEFDENDIQMEVFFDQDSEVTKGGIQEMLKDLGSEALVYPVPGEMRPTVWRTTGNVDGFETAEYLQDREYDTYPGLRPADRKQIWEAVRREGYDITD